MKGIDSAAIAFPARALCLRDQPQFLRTRRPSAVAFVEMRRDVVQRLVAPFLGFGEQLPAVFGMKCSALAVQGFHGAAVNELFHRHLPDSVDDILSAVLRRCHYDYATGRLPYRGVASATFSKHSGMLHWRLVS